MRADKITHRLSVMKGGLRAASIFCLLDRSRQRTVGPVPPKEEWVPKSAHLIWPLKRGFETLKLCLILCDSKINNRGKPQLLVFGSIQGAILVHFFEPLPFGAHVTRKVKGHGPTKL